MKKFFLLFSFLMMTTMLLFLGGCQKDLQEEKFNSKDDFASSEFASNYFNNKIRNGGCKLLIEAWEIDGVKYAEYLPNVEVKIVDPSNTDLKYEHRILVKNNNGVIDTFLIEYKGSGQISTLFNSPKYTGAAMVIGKDNVILDLIEFRDGVYVQSIYSTEFQFQRVKHRNAEPCTLNFNGLIWFDPASGPVPTGYIALPITTEIYVDWYQSTQGGSWEYLDTKLKNINTQYVLVPCEGVAAGDQFYKQYFEHGWVNAAGDPIKTVRPGVTLNDPCHPDMTTSELGHELIKKLEDKTMVELLTQLEQEEFYKMDNFINSISESNNYSFPCDPDMSINELLNEAMENMTDCNLDEFKKSFGKMLEGVDHIIIDPSFSNCEKLKCIYDKLLNSGSKMFCNNIYKFNYTSAIDLKISVGTPASNAEAHVTMGKNGDGVEMVFNKWNCDETDHLRLAETMLHESVHAKFRYDHARNGTTEAEYRKNFLKYVNEKYGIPYDDHTLMIKKYMNKLATELWELNGEKYDPSYYMAWVAEGLEQYWPEKFSEADKKSWKDKRDIVNANNPFKCKK